MPLIALTKGLCSKALIQLWNSIQWPICIIKLVKVKNSSQKILSAICRWTVNGQLADSGLTVGQQWADNGPQLFTNSCSLLPSSQLIKPNFLVLPSAGATPHFLQNITPLINFFLFRFFYVFYPLTGIVGLNNIKANDYLNVVLQVRMMVALNSLAPMIWFRILPTGCHTFLCLSTKRVKCPVKASLSIHISNVMEFVLSYFKFKGVRDTLLNGKQFERVLYMYYLSHY